MIRPCLIALMLSACATLPPDYQGAIQRAIDTRAQQCRGKTPPVGCVETATVTRLYETAPYTEGMPRSASEAVVTRFDYRRSSGRVENGVATIAKIGDQWTVYSATPSSLMPYPLFTY